MKKKIKQKTVPPFKQIACATTSEDRAEPTLYGLDKKGRAWVLDNGYWYPVETRLAPGDGDE